MPDHLQKLKRELRSEKCPPEVLARVRERINDERSSHGTSVPTFAILAVVAAVVVALISLRQPASHDSESAIPPSLQAQGDTPDVSRAARETGLSLACVGQVLLDAGTHSEAVLRKTALPPLYNSWTTLQNTLKTQNGS